MKLFKFNRMKEMVDENVNTIHNSRQMIDENEGESEEGNFCFDLFAFDQGDLCQ